MNPLKFRTRKSLIDHFMKHGLRYKTPEEYERLANEVFQKGVKVPAKRGAIRVYNPSTNEHVIIDPKENKLLTFYIRRAILE